MQNTYIEIMIQSLRKKLRILEEIKSINQLQKDLLENDKSDVDNFDKTVEDKSDHIKQLELLDTGFDKLFERVKEELNKDKDAYKEQIHIMQNLIRQITDYSIEIQAQEARNKELMIRKMTSVREQAKSVRTNGKVVSNY